MFLRTSRRGAYLFLGASIAAFPVAAAANADADAAAAADVEQGDILVTGQRPEYGAEETCSATRTCTPVKDVPQALTVISESQIEDQALRSIADVLQFVPGAMAGTGESNRDQITIRGQNTTADFFRDGLRDDVQYFRDLYNVERVEVLRGPNAMIFGRGGGGGVVNRVTKRASGGEYREFALAGDSEGGVRLTGDVDHPLADGVGLRVNGMFEEGESFRRFVEIDRWGLNPTLGAAFGGTRLDLGYEYFQDRRTTDRGIPAFDDRPLEGHDRTFFGDPELSFAEADAHIGSFAVQHAFSDALTLRNRTLWGEYDKFYQNVYPTNLIEATGEVTLGAYNSRNDRTNLITQTDLVWTGETGGIGHTLLLGVELGRQKSRNRRASGSFAGGDNRVTLEDPTDVADVVFAPGASDANNRVRAGVAAIYVQDQIRLSPMFEIVAGLRFDRFRVELDDLRGAGAQFARTDELVSPRLGLIAKPGESLSLYASYSRSYLPASGDQFADLNASAEALKPERFDNYEIGAKWEPIEGLLASAALYQLDRTNTRAPDPADPSKTVLTGAQRSRGIELGLERNISDRWQISAGYALQEAEIRSRTTACDPAADSCEVPLVPRHQFSMWSRYDVTDALGLGLGIVARTKAWASLSNDVVLPGYARVDAALFYELTDGIEAQLNVENLFGADYFATAHNDNNIAPGAPTTARAALRFRF